MANNRSKKNIYTELDFSEMGWHDCKFYALAFNEEKYEIAFDIDYIIDWVNPQDHNDSHYKFWVAPATLVFRNVYDININLYSSSLQIQDVFRTNPTTPKNKDRIKDTVEYDWTIETTNGEVAFKATGYTQYLRDEAKLFNGQFIDSDKRGDISFSLRTPG